MVGWLSGWQGLQPMDYSGFAGFRFREIDFLLNKGHTSFVAIATAELSYGVVHFFRR
jgi:hypothetical protein